MSENTNYKFETLQQHAGQVPDPATGARAVPIYQTTSYVFKDTQQAEDRFALKDAGYIYSRLTNPTQDVLEKRIAALEGGTAGLATASGASAIAYSIINLAGAGDEIIAAPTLYGGTVELFSETFKHLGITTHFADPDDPQSFAKYINDKTKAIYLESLGNPAINIPDFEAIAEIAHKNGLPVIVDNTFSTPYIQTPIDLGADIVIHSATKYLNGHGDVIAGMAVGTKEFINECNMFGLKDMTGAVLGPFEAFLIDRGMKTLDIRVQKHCDNAMKVARFLESHPMVERVLYPGLESHPRHELAKKQMEHGFGGIVTFELKCGREKSAEFVNSLKLCTIAVSLGDAETLIEHPATMTHSTYTPEALAQAGIGESMLRLSVGLEDAEDIIADLKEGLDRIK